MAEDARVRLMIGGNTQGRRRLFEHKRSQGEQVETLWNQGRQSIFFADPKNDPISDSDPQNDPNHEFFDPLLP